MTTFAALLTQMGDGPRFASDESQYEAKRVPRQQSYLVGRSAAGQPALLVRTASSEPAMPLRLAGISAFFGVPCSISEEGVESTEDLSIVECLSTDAEQVAYFAACMDMLLSALGPQPTIASLAAAVDRLVAMFQALASAPRREVTGVIGELCFILAAAEPGAAVRAWHADPLERYDFTANSIRVEVKATSGASRIHALSADQACPPAGISAILASTLVRPAGGGTTVGELVQRISRRLGRDHQAIFTLQEQLVRLLGSTLQNALGYTFDLEQALESLLIFDMNEVPALRPPFPPEVSDVRFRVNLDDSAQVDLDQLRSALPSASAELLPAPEAP